MRRLYRRQFLAYALGLLTATAGFAVGAAWAGHAATGATRCNACVQKRATAARTSRTRGAEQACKPGDQPRSLERSPGRRAPGRRGSGCEGRRRRTGSERTGRAGRFDHQRAQPEPAVHDHAVQPGHPAQGSAEHADDQRRRGSDEHHRRGWIAMTELANTTNGQHSRRGILKRGAVLAAGALGVAVAGKEAKAATTRVPDQLRLYGRDWRLVDSQPAAGADAPARRSRSGVRRSARRARRARCSGSSSARGSQCSRRRAHARADASVEVHTFVLPHGTIVGMGTADASATRSSPSSGEPAPTPASRARTSATPAAARARRQRHRRVRPDPSRAWRSDAMAYDAFLKLDGIDGEVTADGHDKLDRGHVVLLGRKQRRQQRRRRRRRSGEGLVPGPPLHLGACRKASPLLFIEVRDRASTSRTAMLALRKAGGRREAGNVSS